MKSISKERYVIVYPQYFDSRASRKMGRRVPKGLAVDSPSLARIEEACRKLGLKIIVEPDKAYPRASNVKCGRIVVFCKDMRKKSIIEKIGRAMKGGVG
ncbi:MAG: signal recognition particle subunit SRP19/SEC65 family protein [Candidatus Brockarchaeota archaeon]|nr:signal recognition particle subunit SRP19/SEC65 family protein [Candidatus Brockarchaeota archaeon]